MLRYRIKVRLVELGMTAKLLREELAKRGYKVDAGDFSKMISGKRQGQTADIITAEADKILCEREGKR